MIAVSHGVGPVIMLASGATLDLLDPFRSEFTTEDIAHGLAHTCRYAGQCRSFYSVAEHSLLVAEVVPNHGLAALLHDAAEAFIGDVTRPLKQLLPDYRRIEASVEAAIFARFGLPGVMPPAVKRADLAVLAAEQIQVMPPGTASWAREAGIEPARVEVRFLEPERAKREFLDRFARARRQVPLLAVAATAGSRLEPGCSAASPLPPTPMGGSQTEIGIHGMPGV